MTTITALPPAPSRTDPTTFSSKSDALLGAFDQFVTETNTVAGEVVSNRDLASTYATNASNSASAASTSASTAATQAGLATTNGAAQVSLAAAQVSLATTQANNASSSASTATTQAGTATTQAGIATTQAGIATTQAGIATTKAAEADASAIAAAASAASIADGPVTSVNGMTGVVTGLQSELVSGTNIKTINGTTVLGSGNFSLQSTLVSGTSIKTVNSTSLLGSGDVAVQPTLVSGTNIKTVQGTSLLGSGDVSIGVSRSTRTSNTILGTADKGYFIDITSGTFTQTFTAAATLTNGWWCYIRNSGTGDITLDPNSSEQIDGLTSYVMYPGETRLIQCNGSAFFSFIISGFYKTFTSTGTFTTPPGYRLFEGLLWSGGSSGQLSIGTAVAGGGGGGGCFPFTIPASSFAASETITIGAGGAAVTVAAVGNVGGSSSIGSLLTVGCNSTWTAGGSVLVGGSVIMQYSASYPANGFDGSLTATSNANARTVYGGAGSSDSNPGYVGSSVYGGGGGGVSYGSGLGGAAAGTSLLGGNGGAYGYYANGTAGSAPGGGGGGSSGGSQSGAGGRGECRIWGIV